MKQKRQKKEKQNVQLFDLNKHHPPQSLNFAELLHLDEIPQKKERRPLPPLPQIQTERRERRKTIESYQRQLPEVPPRRYKQRIQPIVSTNESESIEQKKKKKKQQVIQKKEENRELLFYQQMKEKIEKILPYFLQLHSSIKDQAIHCIHHRLLGIQGMCEYLKNNQLQGTALTNCHIFVDENGWQEYIETIEECIFFLDRSLLIILDSVGLQLQKRNEYVEYLTSLIPSDQELLLCQHCNDYSHLQQLQSNGFHEISQAIQKWKDIEQMQEIFLPMSFDEIKQTGILGWGRQIKKIIEGELWKTQWIPIQLIVTTDLLIIKSSNIEYLCYLTDITITKESYGLSFIYHLSSSTRGDVYIKQYQCNDLKKECCQYQEEKNDLYQFPL